VDEAAAGGAAAGGAAAGGAAAGGAAAGGAAAGGAAAGGAAGSRGWVRVRLRAERLDWVPAVLAGMDRPFVVEEPVELREQVRALARRLEGFAMQDSPAAAVGG
jgi:hypothetical protein